MDAMDALIGTENTIFAQYGLWMIFDSFNVGGLHRARTAAGSNTKEIRQELYQSDLAHYQKEQEADPQYPMVSLFNLDDDPQETNNLAGKHPELVKELLAEAEDVLKDAPKQWRGDMVDAEAPVSKQQDWIATLRSLGTHLEWVTPFGIYLDDDTDLTKLNYSQTDGTDK
eukprot:TRINITY_DN17893_c0_g1_i1.p1 TRINITY_DN17893_c0_g1~~TRINITY_DN17893_c0_g1_i1.p1  ORF type:complete len:170 (-),score=45.04 TRINITY_DN17893_c0_g1_i1:121-630(-)